MKFKIKGITVEITFLFTALIAFLVSFQAPINVIITIISSLMHELGHLIMMCAVENYPQSVRFELTGINIIRASNLRISIKNELMIALGGPFANGIIFFAFCLVSCFYNCETILTIAAINLILMVFNLLPVKRLDGGMALYFFLSQRLSTERVSRIINFVSFVFIILIYLWGIYVFIANSYNFSVIIIAIFLTISMFGSNEY